jgi:HEAT repeat protein
MPDEAQIRGQLRAAEKHQRLAALGQLMAKDADASPYLADVAASLDHAEVAVRQVAAVVLGRIGAPAAEHLARGLDPAQPATIRMVVAGALGNIGAPAAPAVRPLCRCLTAPEDNLRAIASFALGRIGPASVPALRLMLQFSDPRTVASAVGALSQIGPEARESLADLETIAPRAALPVQMACAAAVARISGDASRGLPLLLQALDHPDPLVRKQSLERITELGPAAHPAIPRILECAADPAPEVRAAAALTLGRIRAPASDVVPPMVRLLDDASPEVRMNAMIVLASWGDAAREALPALGKWTGHADEKTSAAARAAIQRIDPLGAPASRGRDEKRG